LPDSILAASDRPEGLRNSTEIDSSSLPSSSDILRFDLALVARPETFDGDSLFECVVFLLLPLLLLALDYLKSRVALFMLSFISDELSGIGACPL
jgi:hypothetical protein